MTVATPTEVVAAKAHALLDGHRVVVLDAGRALVGGDTAVWTVEARNSGVYCSCPAGGNGDPVSCSHKVAAQVAWSSRSKAFGPAGRA